MATPPTAKLAIIDNYDSFTYNLVQYFGELGVEPAVFRNDEVTVGELAGYDGVVISPGPGTPDDAGVSAGVADPFEATRYHSLIVERSSIPNDLVVTAWTNDGTVMGLRHVRHATYGVQFHPESVLTKEGKKILSNFIRRAAGVGASALPTPTPDPPPEGG